MRRMSIAFRQPEPPAAPVERVAWTLVKSDRRVQLMLRWHPHGIELRCIYQGDVVWTELLRRGHDTPDAVRLAVDDTRAAWLAKGWQA
jgi:hypothetical protein